MSARTGFLLALALFTTPMAFAEEKRTYREGETWVSRHLDSGGDILEVTGLVRPTNWREGATFDDLTPKRNLPPLFDWRWKAGGLQPIKNQSNCGSCWAFSVTATLEALIKIQEQRVVDLAEQTLVSSCSNAGSCGGGYFRAFNYLKSPGLPGEEQDPYRARNSSCRSGLRPEANIVSWAYVGSRNRGPSIEQIKTALMEYGPLSVTIYANSSLSRYKGGIFNDCRRGSENHMVNIEGWNDNEGGYWIMRNSWGTTWGENGYMRIRYTDSSGRKCNNIGETSAYAIYNQKIEH